MDRIAITGLEKRESILVAKALSIMSGYDLILSLPYSQIAFKYGLTSSIEACQWPDSYVYCLGAFTERVIMEQGYAERFVSEGSVFKELIWLQYRFPHVDLIYEQSMIHCMERVFAEYAAKNYDVIFHSETNESGAGLSRLFATYRIPYQQIDFSDRKTALQAMADYLKIKPKMPAHYSLSKTSRELGEDISE
ncbi:MAG: hypothetical protein LBT50_08930 [Prevotellaceae bacterium]|jgi:hypothetical protein|nr:hypothetical protein [Prevotellaceae bacterium]